MLLPPLFEGRLAVPAIAAPMFLVSGPDLVVETCRGGVLGTFPALNARTSELYAAWLDDMAARLSPIPMAGSSSTMSSAAATRRRRRRRASTASSRCAPAPAGTRGW